MRSPTHRAAAAGFAFVLVVTSCAGTGSDATTTASTTNSVEADIAPATTAPVAAAEPDTHFVDPEPAEPTGQAIAAPDPQPETETAEPAVQATAAPEPEPEVNVLAATIALPQVDVVSLASGETAALSSFARPGPTLVWFWAPH